jgi:DNA-binding FadR family transcriptional regulator
MGRSPPAYPGPVPAAAARSSSPPAASSAPAGPSGVAKRAAQVADRIVEDVRARGWPVGQVLGSETELLERYQVSRAVFREAVRLVEHRGVARTRRGPGGGLVVTEPSVDSVIDAVVLYLHRMGATIDEVLEARVILEEIAADLATLRLEEEDLILLRGFLDGTRPDSEPRVFHTCLAASSHNPAIELFVEVLNRLARMYSSGWDLSPYEAEWTHAHSRIAAAVISGDPATARRRMRRHLEAESDYVRARRPANALPPPAAPGDPGGKKMAEAVARSIAYSVVAARLRPGDLIGTEGGLIEREGVSRAVFREAVRLLEYHQIARMRRGPGGGLFVLRTGPGAVADIAAIYLARQGMELPQLSELRTAVETAIVDLAVQRIDDAGRARVLDALERESGSSEGERLEVVHDLHAALAGVAGNRVLELVALVIIRLSRMHQVAQLASRSVVRIRAEVDRVHSGIVTAVLDGDRELARHRMQRHLDAIRTITG